MDVEPEPRVLLALGLSETRSVLVAYSLPWSSSGARQVVADGAKWYFAAR